MARISSYTKDNSPNDNDLLVGSEYLNTINGIDSFQTRSYKLRDLATYFANYNESEGNVYSLATFDTSITTNATNIGANASKITNLGASFGVMDANGNVTSVSEAFANQVLNVATSADYASASQLTALTTSVNNNTASISTNATDITSVTSSATTNTSNITTNTGNISTVTTSAASNASAITALQSSLTTANTNITQNASDVTSLTSTVTTNTTNITSNDTDITTANTNIATNASNITTLTNNLATTNTNVTQNATDTTSLTSTVTTNTTNITNKPNIFRQDAAPAVTEPVGSIWYDTNDNNKTYVLTTGTPNVWTVTDNARIAANETSISTNTTNVATNASDITTLENNLTTANTAITQNATNHTSLSSDVTTNTTTLAVKPNVYRQDAAPAVSVPVGSLWYDTNDSNKVYILVAGSPNTWNETTDARVAANASSITTANTNINTNATNITALTSNLATSNTNITNNASNITTLDTSVSTNATNINGKPDVFRQNDPPAVTNPIGSMWFDTNDNNKAYVLVGGTPNVWTLTNDTRISTNATNIATLDTAVTTAENNISANSTNITTLDTDLNTAEGNITSNASNITSLTTTVNGNTTSISTNATSINGIEGRYGVTIDSNGALTGFQLIGSATTSIFKVNADDFKIYTSGGDLNPFSVSGGVVQINGNLNVAGTAEIKGSSGSGQFIACDFKNTGSSGLSSIRILNSNNYYGLFRLNTTVAGDIGYYGIDLVIGPATGGGEKKLVNFNGGGISMGLYGTALIFNDGFAGDYTVAGAGGIRVAGSSDGQATQAMFITVPTNQAASTPAFAIENSSSSSLFKVFKNSHVETGSVQTSGNISAAGTLTGTQFIDASNSAYYLNPSSTSNLNAATLVGTLSGQNAYFLQKVGIGFNSGSIGGKLNIKATSVGINIKNDYGTAGSGTIGLLGYTDSSMNTSGAYHMIFQADPGTGSLDNMLLCDLDGNLRNRNNSYGQYSDQSLKENIVDATSKLEDVKKLKVRNFNFIGDELKQIGLIAQETELVFPGLVEDIVTPQGDDIKSLKYSVLVPILIKAIQELEARVKELES